MSDYASFDSSMLGNEEEMKPTNQGSHAQEEMDARECTSQKKPTVSDDSMEGVNGLQR